MSIEIERKFLVEDTSILINTCHKSYTIGQYYINENMRIRFITHSNGAKIAYITIKHKKKVMTRSEWEFEIDVSDALSYCSDMKSMKIGLGEIQKTRHLIPDHYGMIWEIDVFHHDNEGLVLAEVELPSEDFKFGKLECIGEEVTNDERYYNSYLAKNPYKNWSK